MGKVVFLDPIDHISGKISKRFRTVYNYRAKGNCRYTSTYTTPTGEVPAAVLASRQKFAQAVAQAQAIMADQSQRATYEANFAKQNKYLYLRNFIMAEVRKGL